MLAGCGFAVHFLKAIGIKIPACTEVDIRDYVDDLVLHSDSPSKEQVVLDMQGAIDAVADTLEGYHQVANKAKEHIFVSIAEVEKLLEKLDPGHQGAIGGRVKDLGVTIKTLGRASLNRSMRIGEASAVNRGIGALPFTIGDKVTMVKDCWAIQIPFLEPTSTRSLSETLGLSASEPRFGQVRVPYLQPLVQWWQIKGSPSHGLT